MICNEEQLAFSRDLIKNAEQAMGKLTDGQRRDLLCDNTDWTREEIEFAVGTPMTRAAIALVPLLVASQSILRRSQNRHSDRADEKIGEAFDRLVDTAREVSEVMTSLKNWANFPDAANMEVSLDMALDELRAIEEGGPTSSDDDFDDSCPPPCSNPGGHEWPAVEERERSFCIHCGADGDA